MRPHQLKALIATAEHGSIRAAARSVFLSQAALTKALKELEDEMDVGLITRTTHGVHLTEAGRLLYTRAQAIVAEMKAARNDIERMKGASMGTLSAAISPLPAVTILPAAYTAFRRRMPDVIVDFTEGNLQQSLPRLREGALDFVVAGSIGTHTSREFSHVELCTDEVVFLCRRGHPLQHVRSIHDVLANEWIYYSANTDYMQELSDTFAVTGTPTAPRIVRCSSITIAISLLVNSDAIAYLPLRLLEPEWLGSILVRMDIEQRLPVLSVRVFTRRHSPVSAPAQLMLDCLRDAARRDSMAATPVAPVGLLPPSSGITTL